jgi:hypothetical protein
VKIPNLEARSSNRESDGHMTSAPIRDPLADHLITPQNAALLLIDYQPAQVPVSARWITTYSSRTPYRQDDVNLGGTRRALHCQCRLRPETADDSRISRSARERQTARPDDSQLVGRHRPPTRAARTATLPAPRAHPDRHARSCRGGCTPAMSLPGSGSSMTTFLAGAPSRQL